MSNRNRSLVLVVWLAAFGVSVNSTQAFVVAYSFSTTVSSVSPGAPNFPASLAGVNPGDTITGFISYNSATSATPNPTPGEPFVGATYYELLSPIFSFTIGGVTFDTWDPDESAYVWNDYPTSPLIFPSNDGLLFTNLTALGNPQFVVGNTVLPTSTFTNEDLPDDDIPGNYSMTLSSSGSANWLQSNLFTLVNVTGDLNNDGFVGIDDLNIVLSNWNQSVPPADFRADPSGDWFVGIDDLNAVLGNWNAGTPPNSQASIPEPGIAWLFGLSVISMMKRRQAV